MEKVIFLDIDGVLNSSDLEEYLDKNCVSPNSYYYNLLDQRAILLLADIVYETNAKIVISSSWRLSESQIKSIALQLAPYKLEIYSTTPSIASMGRAFEIKTWLEEHKEVEKFVILDDDCMENNEFAPFLVKTSWEHGLEKEHAKIAVEILRGE